MTSTKTAMTPRTKTAASFRAPQSNTGGTKTSRSRRSGSEKRRRDTPSVGITSVADREAFYLTSLFMLLTMFGLVMVLSASMVTSLHDSAGSPYFEFQRQVVWALIGASGFIYFSTFDYHRLRRFAGLGLLLCIGLLILVLVPGLGINAGGSTRWLGVGSFRIQPSELAKLAMIIFAADILARRERRMDRPELTVRPLMLTLGLLTFLMILQPKLGTPIIIAAITLVLLFIAGAKLRHILPWAFGAAAIVVTLALAAGYRQRRLTSFLDPWNDPLGEGFQMVQSQIGIASGGWFGVGLGASRSKWGFLPTAHSDFIFAVIAEEVGLIGSSLLVLAFVTLCCLGLRVAMNSQDRFGMLLAAGITCWLGVQAFLNIGMVLGVLPITGEALPFISAGGSSLVTTLVAAGILVNVARQGFRDG